MPPNSGVAQPEWVGVGIGVTGTFDTVHRMAGRPDVWGFSVIGPTPGVFRLW